MNGPAGDCYPALAADLLQSAASKHLHPQTSANQRRIACTACLGQRSAVAALSDDRYQQLSLTRIADNGSSDLVASWPVYDDQVYPYGDNSYDEANFSREPQEIHT